MVPELKYPPSYHRRSLQIKGDEGPQGLTFSKESMKLRCKFRCNGYFLKQCTVASHSEGYIDLNLNFFFHSKTKGAFD